MHVPQYYRSSTPVIMARTSMVKVTRRLWRSILSKMFLIVVDAYSKRLEVIPVCSATFLSAIEQFRSILSVYCLHEVLVTDNGTAFTSNEFQEFM